MSFKLAKIAKYEFEFANFAKIEFELAKDAKVEFELAKVAKVEFKLATMTSASRGCHIRTLEFKLPTTIDQSAPPMLRCQGECDVAANPIALGPDSNENTPLQTSDDDKRFPCLSNSRT